MAKNSSKNVKPARVASAAAPVVVQTHDDSDFVQVGAGAQAEASETPVAVTSDATVVDPNSFADDYDKFLRQSTASAVDNGTSDTISSDTEDVDAQEASAADVEIDETESSEVSDVEVSDHHDGSETHETQEVAMTAMTAQAAPNTDLNGMIAYLGRLPLAALTKVIEESMKTLYARVDAQRRELDRAESLIATRLGAIPGAHRSAPIKKSAPKTTSEDGSFYRNPKDHSQTWTGRGRPPAWAVELRRLGRLDTALVSLS